MKVEKKPFIVELDSQLKQLAEELSNRRKKAEDVKIAGLLFMNIKAKITMAEATETQKDIDAAYKSMALVWSELKENDKLRAFGKDYKELEYKANELVEELKEAVASKDKSRAQETYEKLRPLYKNLTKEKKKEVVDNLSAVFNK